MKKILNSSKRILVPLFSFLVLALVFSLMTHSTFAASTSSQGNANPDLMVNTGDVSTGGLGFQIPNLGEILTFAIRGFFTIAGLAALFYMLLGAFAWVTSGGDKDAVAAAQQKIQAAVVGMIIIVAVLAIVWTLETVVFGSKICFGLTCAVTIPTLVN